MKKLALILLPLLFAPLAYSANVPDFPFLVSSGNAERQVKPNEATVQLHIKAFDKKSKLALHKLDETTAKIVTVLKKYKIDIVNLKGGNLEKNTIRKRDSDSNRLDITGFEVSRAITLKLDNLKSYTEVMNDLLAIDNLSRASTNFDVSNRADIESDLIATASDKARKKAEQMAAGFGTKIQSVYAVSQDAGFGGLLRFSEAQFRLGEASRAYASDGANSSYRTVMFVPESISIKQGINVVFKIQ